MLINPGKYEERGQKIEIQDEQDHDTGCFLLRVNGVTFYFNEAGNQIPASKHEDLRDHLKHFGIKREELVDPKAGMTMPPPPVR